MRLVGINQVKYIMLTYDLMSWWSIVSVNSAKFYLCRLVYFHVLFYLCSSFDVTTVISTMINVKSSMVFSVNKNELEHQDYT